MKLWILLSIIVSLASYASADCSQYDDSVCEGLTGGVFIRSPQSCQRWVQCHENVIHNCDICPDGLYFDEVQGHCTHPGLVECDIPSVATCTPGLISRLPHPTSCSIYFQCLGQGEPIEHTCAETLHFDKYEERCDFIDNVRCMREPIVVECPETELPFTNEPHPFDCKLYFMCINGVSHEQRCLPGMHFDVNLRQCQVISEATCVDDL